jgi:hypothetical protein
MANANSTSSPDVSRIAQNFAVLCRTAVVIFIAWIILRLTWPGAFWQSHLAALTVGLADQLKAANKLLG